MIEHYLSSNNEMCYSTKTQTFSRTKHQNATQQKQKQTERVGSLEILKHKMNRVVVSKALVHISCHFQFLKGAGKFGKKNYVTLKTCARTTKQEVQLISYAHVHLIQLRTILLIKDLKKEYEHSLKSGCLSTLKSEKERQFYNVKKMVAPPERLKHLQ